MNWIDLWTSAKTFGLEFFKSWWAYLPTLLFEWDSRWEMVFGQAPSTLLKILAWIAATVFASFLAFHRLRLRTARELLVEKDASAEARKRFNIETLKARQEAESRKLDLYVEPVDHRDHVSIQVVNRGRPNSFTAQLFALGKPDDDVLPAYPRSTIDWRDAGAKVVTLGKDVGDVLLVARWDERSLPPKGLSIFSLTAPWFHGAGYRDELLSLGFRRGQGASKKGVAMGIVISGDNGTAEYVGLDVVTWAERGDSNLRAIISVYPIDKEGRRVFGRSVTSDTR